MNELFIEVASAFIFYSVIYSVIYWFYKEKSNCKHSIFGVYIGVLSYFVVKLVLTGEASEEQPYEFIGLTCALIVFIFLLKVKQQHKNT